MERSMLATPAVMSSRRVARARRGIRRAVGFTLVELAIVVTIVGVLAVIAVVGYRKYVLHSKITEAKGVISAIRIAQEDHRAEKGSYADLGATFCPTAAGLSDRKVYWDVACSGGGTNVPATWSALPVHIDGPVHFKYATVAGPGPFNGNPLGTTWVSWGTHPQAWYIIAAQCDLDGDVGNMTEVAGSSFTNDIFTHNEGM